MSDRNSLPAIFDGSPADRRRSPRVLIDVPLVIRGESAEQKQFREETFTISVSAYGALIVLAAKVSLGQRLMLLNPETRAEREGRVARFGARYGGLAQVAAWSLRILLPNSGPRAAWPKFRNYRALEGARDFASGTDKALRSAAVVRHGACRAFLAALTAVCCNGAYGAGTARPELQPADA